MPETTTPQAHDASDASSYAQFYFRAAVKVPPPRSPAESVPFIESLLSTVPDIFQLDLCALHAGGDDELDGLTLDRARQLGFSHQLRRVLAGQLLAVLFERQGRVALARRAIRR